MLSSKLCHDLISPIGAVSNGVEFLEEMGADAGEEVTSLIAHSAGQASAKLRAYRMAFGAGGADASIKPEDVHKIMEDYLAGDGKIKQQWDPHAPIGPDDKPDGFCKILINALLIATQCLARGGTMSVETEGDRVNIIATGEGAKFKDGSENALTGNAEESSLSPQNIHPHVFSMIAAEYGYALQTSADDDRIVLSINIV